MIISYMKYYIYKQHKAWVDYILVWDRDNTSTVNIWITTIHDTEKICDWDWQSTTQTPDHFFLNFFTSYCFTFSSHYRNQQTESVNECESTLVSIVLCSVNSIINMPLNYQTTASNQQTADVNRFRAYI